MKKLFLTGLCTMLLGVCSYAEVYQSPGFSAKIGENGFIQDIRYQGVPLINAVNLMGNYKIPEKMEKHDARFFQTWDFSKKAVFKRDGEKLSFTVKSTLSNKKFKDAADYQVVCVMEPTTEAFFCWPYPTTTTSSNCWELSSKVTRSRPPSVTFTSCGFIPTNEITSTALSGTFRVKLPSMSEIVPMELLPLTTTEAPMTVSPLLSKITPFTVLPPVFCAVAVRQPNSMQKHR